MKDGAPLYWAPPQVNIGVENGSVLRGISTETARDVLTRSMDAWINADCGGRHPSISVAPIELIDVGGASPTERDATSDASNALRFFDDSWPHDPAAIALTTVRYGLESGRIVAADIEANAMGYALTVVDTGGEFDLESVLTHESGHFFGLAHVVETEPTMYAAYGGRGNIDRRTLEDNDIQGICTVYPPNRFDDRGGCSCDIGRRTGERRSWIWLALGLAFGARLRRGSSADRH